MPMWGGFARTNMFLLMVWMVELNTETVGYGRLYENHGEFRCLGCRSGIHFVSNFLSHEMLWFAQDGERASCWHTFCLEVCDWLNWLGVSFFLRLCCSQTEP